jgi:hypothetical protein
LVFIKNGRAINPQRVVTVTKTKLKGQKKKEFLTVANLVKKELIASNENSDLPLKIGKFENTYQIIQ